MLFLLDKRVSRPWYANSSYSRGGFDKRVGSAFVRNDAKVFRFCTSKYVYALNLSTPADWSLRCHKNFKSVIFKLFNQND